MTPDEGSTGRVRQLELLAAGEHEEARPLLLVYQHLYVGHQVGRALDLVEDRPVGVLRQESPRILSSELADVVGLHVRVRQMRERMATQCRLP